MPIYTVRKLDHTGSEMHRYQGELLKREQHRIILEAYFDREDTPVGQLVLRRGDHFLEAYFDDRWYNIFEVRDREDHQLKGWYCNLSCPAEFREAEIAYRDLALDLLVYPDGRQVVLDEHEFNALPLSVSQLAQVRQALAELKAHFKQGISFP